MPGDYAAVDAHIAGNMDGWLAELSALCRIASVSARHENIPECADQVAASLHARGFAVALSSASGGHPVVVGRAEGTNRGRTMLFYCHYDVQPAEPLELWDSPPFEPVVRDGALYARGAKDDKGELVARLAALDALRAVDGAYPCDVVFMVEGEEEIGSPNLAAWFAEHADEVRCDAAIWEEGGVNARGEPQLILGRRGILYVELSVETLAFDAHSGQANLLPSATWRLIWALATLKGQDERVRIPGFYDAVRPPTPRQEALLATRRNTGENLKRQFKIDRLLLGRSGADVPRAVFEPTCNVAGMGGGYQGPGSKTIVPARASAKIDFRLVPDQDPDEILARLRAHLDAEGFPDVRVEPLSGYRPGVTQPDHPLVALTAEIGREIYGQPAQMVPINWGTSPCYLFTDQGVPVVSPGVGYASNRTHGPNEHVRLGDFERAARHLARLVDRFGRGEG